MCMSKMEYCIPKLKTRAEAVKLKGSVFTKPYHKKKTTHGKEKSCRAKKDVLPWCSGYHFCTTLLKYFWTQVLRSFKPCSRRVGDSRWSGYLTMVPAENEAKRLSSVNYTIIIHHHHHQCLKAKIKRVRNDIFNSHGEFVFMFLWITNLFQIK